MGGYIDPGETALQAAKRELREELEMESENWVDLGSFRTAINRGGGNVYSFLARSSKTISGERLPSKTGDEKQPVQGELERQDIVLLSREEIVENCWLFALELNL